MIQLENRGRVIPIFIVSCEFKLLSGIKVVLVASREKE